MGTFIEVCVSRVRTRRLVGDLVLIGGLVLIGRRTDEMLANGRDQLSTGNKKGKLYGRWSDKKSLQVKKINKMFLDSVSRLSNLPFYDFYCPARSIGRVAVFCRQFDFEFLI